MAGETHNDEAAVGRFVDYKNVVLGSCTLIVLLIGAIFRLWDSGNSRDREELSRRIDKLDASYERCETRLTEMEAGHARYRFEIEHLKRALERR